MPISRRVARFNKHVTNHATGPFAGRLPVASHLGDLNELMVLGALAGAEMSMLDVGIKIEPGSGVAAAQKYFRTHDNVPKKKVARSEVVYASQSMGSTEGAH